MNPSTMLCRVQDRPTLFCCRRVQAVPDSIVYHTDCAACADSGAALDCILVAHIHCLAAVNHCPWSRICGACERVLDGKACRIGATATQVYCPLGRRSRALTTADSPAAADPCKRAYVRMLGTHLDSVSRTPNTRSSHIDRFLPLRIGHDLRG